MAINLGSAYGKVGLDISGLLSAVKSGKASMQTLALAGEQLGSALQSAGRTLTLGLTLPIAATGAAAIKAASDYEETKNKAVVVFGEMADGIVDSSNKAATALGVSKTQYLDYASSIGSALTAGGMSVKKATELSEQAVKHFADLASFHNSQVQDVSIAWQSAIRGQFEPIQRYFPFITNQYLITYGTANGLVDANTKQLDANQRAIILNAIALDGKLNPALNDFAETSGGLANQTRIMNAQFKDALVMLGTNLLPVALKLVTALNAMLTSFNNMSPGMQKAVLAFAGFLAVLGPVLSVVGTIISFVSTLAGLAPMLSGVGISLGSIGAAAGTAGTALVGVGASALLLLGQILLLAAGPVILYLAFKNNFMGITTTVQQGWFLIQYYFSQGWASLVRSVSQGATNVINWFRTLGQRITEFFRKLDWGQVGKYIMLGIANGLLLGIPSAVAAAISAAKAIMKAFDKELDIHSPSGEFEKRGRFSVLGYMKGLGNVDPNDVARTLSRPVLNQSTSRQVSSTINLSNGLTLRDAEQMFARNNDMLFRKLDAALGGS